MKLRTRFSFGWVVFVLLFAQSSSTFAFQYSSGYESSYGYDQQIPQLPNNLKCAGKNGQPLPFNNAQILQWKAGTPDQYLDRGLAQGTVTTLYPSRTGHTHFAIDLNGDKKGDLEVIYNDEFGELPRIQVGMQVIACGDYITVGPRARLPSPMGAIIHWVHFNPGDRDGGRHPGGFLIIGGKPYGFTNPN